MSRTKDLADENAAKVAVLETKINETIVTLQELKVIVSNPSDDGAAAVLEATNAKVDELLTNLGAAETDADPTPDA